MNLTQLANKYLSDKGTVTGNPPHRYTHIYDLIFYPIKNDNINFLEMGLAIGGPEVGGPKDRTVPSPSVNMWLEYFPNAHVIGFDISDFSHLKQPRFQFVRGDSGSIEDVMRLAASAPQFNVVIDDASHASYHQQLALKCLWPKLASGGIYIIEDLQWQSPAFEDVLPFVPKTRELLETMFMGGTPRKSKLIDSEFAQRLVDEAYSYSSFGALDGSPSTLKQIILRKR